MVDLFVDEKTISRHVRSVTTFKLPTDKRYIHCARTVTCETSAVMQCMNLISQNCYCHMFNVALLRRTNELHYDDSLGGSAV